MSKQDIETIQKFLEYCLDDGFYSFRIGNKGFPLGMATHIPVVLKAIENAEEATKRCFLSQAKHGIKVFEAQKMFESLIEIKTV